MRADLSPAVALFVKQPTVGLHEWPEIAGPVLELPRSPGPWLEIPETPALHPEMPRTPIPTPGGAETEPWLLGNALFPQTAATHPLPLVTPCTPMDRQEAPTTPRPPPDFPRTPTEQPSEVRGAPALAVRLTPHTAATHWFLPRVAPRTAEPLHESPDKPGPGPEMPRTPIPGPPTTVLPQELGLMQGKMLPLPTTPATPATVADPAERGVPWEVPKTPAEIQPPPTVACPILETPRTPMLGAVCTQAGTMQGMMLLPHTAILDFPTPMMPELQTLLLTTESVTQPAEFSPVGFLLPAPIVTHPALPIPRRFVLLV